MHSKIAVIVWTLDPEGNKRFLLRHNKPFGDHEDQWTIVFGDKEEHEAMHEAAIREVEEELGIVSRPEYTRNLDYKITLNGKKGSTEIHFFSIEVEDIEIKIKLNEESIGYDWAKIGEVKNIMQHKDEINAFELI